MKLLSHEFESCASASSATEAILCSLKIKLAEIASDFIINYIIKIVKVIELGYNINVK